MTEISLRAYIEYINDRLDRDAYGEVMAQCRHILETYPKYIEVYKQLARALAAQENFTDALDMFQRVLSADPTDFVAHIGMSECYKEDGVLDQAIWHLERAFEQVPGNSELQDALKQLYEQRDRKAPRKIQMTGGALARMYIRGKLYPQAISELTKAIAHDPDRLDLQILMAESLWQDHQYVAAGKVAAEVLKKLPYSIAANRILAQLWLHAEQPKEARPFLERVRELDPYLGYEFEHGGQTAPADVFQIIMLDYVAAQTATGRGDVADWVAEIDGIEKRHDVTGPLSAPAISSDVFAPPAGMPTKAASEVAAPDWLQDALQATGSTPAGAAATPGSLAGAEPDWLRDALTGPGTQPPVPPAEGAPDWLSDAVGQTPPSLSPVPASQDGAPDWLKDVLGGSGETQPSAETPLPSMSSPPMTVPGGGAPEWLKDVLIQETPAQPAAAMPAPIDDAPDWLRGALTQGRPSEPSEALSSAPSDAPDWLQEALTIPGQPGAPSEPASAGGAPDWLQQESPDQPSAASLPEEMTPEWLKDAAPQAEPILPTAPPEPASPENAPAWLSKVLSERTPPSLEPVPADWGQAAGDEERVAPEWLDNIVSGTEAPSAPPSAPTPQVQPATPSIVSEEWLDQFITGSPSAPIEELPLASSMPAGTPSDSGALGDLEAWDAPQEKAGVSPLPENWLTQDTGLDSPSAGEPEEKSQELPDWLVSGALADASDAGADLEQPVQEEATKKDLPDWLKMEPETVPEEIPVLEEEKYVAPPDDELRDGGTSPEEDIPDWLESGDLDSDDALKWLEEIAAKVDPNFTPSGAADESAPAEPIQAEAKAEEATELPTWLKAEAAPAQPVAAPEPAAEEGLSDWLKSEALPTSSVEAAPMVGGDIEWLREPTEATKPSPVEEEAGLPDWLSAEEKEAPKEAVSEPADALSWLDQQTAEQGVGSDKVVADALTPDHPPVTAPSLPDEKAEAKRITTGELPSWLKEAEAREEMEKALESPSEELEMDELAELPDLPVEADELAWLNETLKVEEQTASIDLEDILGEKAEGAPSAKIEEEELPDWLKEPEPSAKIEEKEEETPAWLKEPEPISAVQTEEKEEELPELLKEPEPSAKIEEKEEEVPAWMKEPEPVSATKAEEAEEELPQWLKEPEPVSATKAEEAEEELPQWLKGPEPVSADKAEEKEEAMPAWLKGPEPVSTLKAEEPEKELPVAEAKEEELPDWLKEPEEALVSEGGEDGEGAEELPDWLTKPEPEPVAASTLAPAPVLEIKEEEGELPAWLTTPEPAVEAAETDLADFLKAVEPAAAPSAPAPEPAPTPLPEPVPVAVVAPPPVAPPPVIAAGDAVAQLQAAREQRSAGELQAALSLYEGLVNAGQHLDETIADLSEVAKTQVVVNPRVYRVMGDAMMGQGRMQDALDMYRKALDQF